MKINRKYLIESIKEALGEDEESAFETLTNIVSDRGEGRGIQALEMMFAFELTEHQVRSIYNVALYNALEYNNNDLPKVLKLRPEEFTDSEGDVHFDMAVEAITTNPDNTNPERLLKEIGYDKTVSLELFNQEWWEKEPEETLRVGLERIKSLFENSD